MQRNNNIQFFNVKLRKDQVKNHWENFPNLVKPNEADNFDVKGTDVEFEKFGCTANEAYQVVQAYISNAPKGSIHFEPMYDGYRTLFHPKAGMPLNITRSGIELEWMYNLCKK